jgi:myosin-6
MAFKGHEKISVATRREAVDDLVLMSEVNEKSIVAVLKKRFIELSNIYTYIGAVLVSVNPYERIPGTTGPEVMAYYRGRFQHENLPHIYATAEDTYRNMRNEKQSQCVIISGESGAGKTECAKMLMGYIAFASGAGAGVDYVKSVILESNPLLEAFGNANTIRNDNSSRFGKFVELHFNKNALVVGAHIEHYLLEKSRCISQSEKERNYHVFYRMCKGAPQTMRDQLNLGKVETFAYLKSGICTDVQFLDDVKDFAVMEKSMNDCGLDGQEKADVFRISAAVLHIGNLIFSDDGGNSAISGESGKTLKGVSALLGLEEEALSTALCFNTISIPGEADGKKAKPVAEANYGRDALGKALYSKLFDWIVGRVNKCFPFDKSENYIGVLDIAGFEYFQVNSFEQFCINYCNEKLQQFFNERVLKDEQELYVKESIKFKEVEYIDNQDCIDLIEMKGTGILAILDETSKLPQADKDSVFTEKLHSTHQSHFRLQLPRKSKMAYYKKLRDSEGFIIRHFAGAVCYQTDGFSDKNNDALTFDLFTLMDSSKDPFTRDLFQPKEGDPRPQRGKITLISLGNKFKNSLSVLMEKLNSTRSSFIRCIKPNQKMSPKLFNGGDILSQLQCAGMVSVLDLMQGGFPSRTAFQDLYDMYKSVLPPVLAQLDPRTFAKALFKALGLNEDDFQFGVSKVFFRPGKFAEFDTIMRADPENLKNLVNKVMEWLVRQRWKKIAWATVSCLKFAAKIRARAGSAVVMQKTILMYMARRVHKPRYQAIRSLRQLTSQLDVMDQVVAKLEKKKDNFVKLVGDLRGELEAMITQIKTTETMTREQIEKKAAEMQTKMDKQLASLKKEQEKQKLAAEAERLKKLAEEMEAQRKAKEDEERKRKEAEDESRRIKEMEQQARKEAQEEEARLEKLRIQQEQEEGNKKVMAKRAEEKKREEEEAQRAEQERRDQELALRLAQDTANPDDALTEDTLKSIRDGPATKRKQLKRQNITFANKKQELIHKKKDLSKWKYADLRDSINTSCDIDLLEACREEFHRRLKVYHAWKMKNQRKQQQSRAPQALHAKAEQRAAAPAAPKKVKKNERPQRFFRIPFVRPGDKEKGFGPKGWWYAHFDGQWIARQMEIHPDRDAVLLVAGQHDMDMCELSLAETGLASKRGAEILPREFEAKWKECGGQPYVQREAPKKK